MLDAPPLLVVDSITKHFPLRRSIAGALLRRPPRAVQAARGVSLEIAAGQSFGLVGESGCGKTTLGRMVLGMIHPDNGNILFQGRNVANATPQETHILRRQMQMVFQDPYSSLNPRLRVGTALAEPLRAHRIVPPNQLKQEVDRLLDRVGLPAAIARRFPSELSGGQRQRVGIARALSVRPKLLVADEAVSGLDVSVRAQVLNLLDDLRKDLGLSLLFISHDLGVVEYLCDFVAVMYLGSVVESGPTERVFAASAHPYTRALLNAIPVAEPAANRSGAPPLAGEPPNPIDPPNGCPFRTRCPRAAPVCTTPPPRVTLPGGYWSACHFATEIAAGPPARRPTGGLHV